MWITLYLTVDLCHLLSLPLQVVMTIFWGIIQNAPRSFSLLLKHFIVNFLIIIFLAIILQNIYGNDFLATVWCIIAVDWRENWWSPNGWSGNKPGHKCDSRFGRNIRSSGKGRASTGFVIRPLHLYSYFSKFRGQKQSNPVHVNFNTIYLDFVGTYYFYWFYYCVIFL